MRRVIFNQKGGVGKSSIAANLAAIDAERGRKTLVVDLDPQGNATRYVLGDESDTVGAGLGAFFEACLAFRLMSPDPTDYVVSTAFEGLSLMPSSPVLAELEPKLATKHKIFKLREALKDLQATYDAIYIDTPPAFNFFSLSALIAADSCLIPFDCDDFSRRALYTLLENIEETRADHNSELHVEGIVINQFLGRAKLPKQLVDELESEGLPVLAARLSSSVKMRESHQCSTPLIYLAPSHKLTREFVDLYEELQAA